MSITQPALDGTIPAPIADDYEEWAIAARPVYVAAAKSGLPFVCWKVARDAKLSNPPDQKRDWARFIGELHSGGVIRLAGFGFARDGSAVRKWIGTTAAREGRAA
jgi:hypothetical protein